MSEPIFEKNCKHCGELKSLDLFYRASQAKDGRRPECRDCTQKRARPLKFGKCITCGCVLRKSSETGECASCLNKRIISEKKPCACGRQLKSKEAECWTCRRDRRIAGDPNAVAQVFEKQCSKCGDVKPIKEFGPNVLNKDGHNGRCKACMKVEKKDHYAEHKDESSARTKAYYKANKTRLDKLNRQNAIDNREQYRPAKRANQKKRYDANPVPFQSEVKRRNAALRIEVLMLFGSYCVCCGESDLRFLTFDHKNGDGAEHRRKIGGSQKASANILFRWAKKNLDEAKGILQLLCWNCNAGSWKNNGICPHQQEFNIVAMAMEQQVALAA